MLVGYLKFSSLLFTFQRKAGPAGFSTKGQRVRHPLRSIRVFFVRMCLCLSNWNEHKSAVAPRAHSVDSTRISNDVHRRSFRGNRRIFQRPGWGPGMLFWSSWFIGSGERVRSMKCKERENENRLIYIFNQMRVNRESGRDGWRMEQWSQHSRNKTWFSTFWKTHTHTRGLTKLSQHTHSRPPKESLKLQPIGETQTLPLENGNRTMKIPRNIFKFTWRLLGAFKPKNCQTDECERGMKRISFKDTFRRHSEISEIWLADRSHGRARSGTRAVRSQIKSSKRKSLI